MERIVETSTKVSYPFSYPKLILTEWQRSEAWRTSNKSDPFSKIKKKIKREKCFLFVIQSDFIGAKNCSLLKYLITRMLATNNTQFQFTGQYQTDASKKFYTPLINTTDIYYWYLGYFRLPPGSSIQLECITYHWYIRLINTIDIHHSHTSLIYATYKRHWYSTLITSVRTVGFLDDIWTPNFMQASYSLNSDWFDLKVSETCRLHSSEIFLHL